MFTLTPIGSCRITGPLRLGEAEHGVRLNLTRCYGYCHSPAEAVQMARFMRGEVEIPKDIWPLVSRSHQHATLAAQAHVPSDLYMIELASAKELKIDGISIQLNYLRSIYPDFFADSDRVQAFWELAASGDRGKVVDFLADTWSATSEQRANSALLARITLNHVTRDSLRRDIRTLSDLLPDLIFVSHVDACKPNGKPIRSRSQFISMVGEEVRRAGLDFFDPTDLMLEFGQPAAIEDDSTSLAHFTREFSAAIMREWMRCFVAPRTDALGEDDARKPEMLRNQLQAAWSAGRFAEVAVRMGTSLTAQERLQQERALARENFHASAKRRMSPADRAEQFKVAGVLGLFDIALQLASDQRDGPEELSTYDLTEVALAAAAAGEYETAEVLALTISERGPIAGRLLELLKLLVLTGQRDLYHVLSPEQSEELQRALSQDEIRVALGKPGAPIQTLVAGSMSSERLVPLVAELASLRGLDTAASVVALWRLQQKGQRLRGADLAALMDHWTEHALASRDPLTRVQRLDSLRLADPRNKSLRAALREAKVDLVARIRHAGKAKDLQSLMAFGQEVVTLDVPLPEYDLWCARLNYETGDFAKTIAYGQRAAQGTPSKINVWVLLMRAGVKSGDQVVAREALEKVIELAGEGNPKLKAEAEKTRNKVMVEV